MLLGRRRRPEVSPRGKRLGAGLPGLLGSCIWSFCLRQVQAVAASAATPVLFILRLPGFLGDCGFVGVDGGFSSGFCADVCLWAFCLLGFRLVAFFPSG